ncbi:MAG: hypothetical protein QGD94_08735 [Planctomycetia bacterium]|nr:hypothetical protein [Planctomycetia bacterium]
MQVVPIVLLVLAAVFARMDPASATAVRLGRETANPAYLPLVEKVPWTERNKWVIYVGMVVVVASLGLIAVKLLRRPPEEDRG